MNKLSKIFNIEYGNGLSLNKLDKTSGEVNFVSRTSKNNGISAKVKIIRNIKPFQKGVITVSLGGSVLEAFVQPDSFYTGYHIYCLTPKEPMEELEKLFYCSCIRANKFRYNYGRQANRTLKDIPIPSKQDIPSWIYDVDLTDFNNANDSENNLPDQSIKPSKWEWFKIEDTFSLEKGKCNNARKLLKEGNDLFYVGAKKKNNGIMKRVMRDESLITAGNCIVFIGDGQGSVGYSTYQPADFIGSSTLTIGRNEKINQYSSLFLVTILDQERFKYSFGRKWNGNKLKNTKIKLPINSSGDPDYEYMENFIKSLPYSNQI